MSPRGVVRTLEGYQQEERVGLIASGKRRQLLRLFIILPINQYQFSDISMYVYFRLE